MTAIAIKAEIEDGKQIADDFSLISVKSCRGCKRRVKPYSEVYEAKEFYGTWVAYRIDFTSGYCKKCAEEKADQINNHRQVYTAYQTDLVKGCHGKETQVMSDGSEIEELTPYDEEYQLRRQK